MKIGMAQLLVEGGEPERNLERAEKLVRRATDAGCQLVLLPETLDLAWTHPSAFTEAQEIPGRFSDFFCKVARQYSIWLCLGLTEKSGDKRYNTALLIDDKGNIVHKYHKINLLEVEHPYYEPGKSLSVVETPFGNVGINICADNYIDSLHIGYSLAHMGAQIILAPSSWTVDHFITEEMDPYKEKWVKPLSTIAKLYEIPVLSTTSVGYIVGGPYEGKKMVGCSLAVNQHGIIAQGEFNEFAGDLKVVDVEIPAPKWKGTQFGEMLGQKGLSTVN
jgi:predicted amidohydrolase